MNTIEVKNELTKYLIARIPFISFNTIEKIRALNILKEIAKEKSINIFTFSMTKGFINIVSEEVVSNDISVVGALDFISKDIKTKENMTYVFLDFPEIDEENVNTRYLCDLITTLEEKNSSIIVISDSNVTPMLQRMGITINLDLPDQNELLTVIKDYTNAYKNSITIEWTDDDFYDASIILLGITLVEAKNVISALIAKGSLLKEDLVNLKFTKDQMFSNINGLEKIEVGDISFSGLNNLKRWLDDKKKLQTPSKKEEMKKRGIRPPRGILIVGVPGCGKSLSAKAIAKNWELPLYLLDFATVQGQYVGQSEKQLKEALEMAERVSPCVLWVDEIEKGLSGNKGDSGVTQRMIGQFLFWLQECKKEVFVVATANDVNSLPPELLRKGRFDEMFFVDLPTDVERNEIITYYFRKYLNIKVSDVFMNQLVKITDGFSGADLESSIRDIAYSVVSDNISITEQVILNKFASTIPLAKSSPESIEKIRAWGKDKTISAS